MFSVRAGIDLPFLTIVLVLLTIGLIMLFSASYAYALAYYGNSYHFFKNQLYLGDPWDRGDDPLLLF